MPLYRRLPKRGFNPIKKENIGLVNLDKLQKLYDKKKINNDIIVNISELKKLIYLKKNTQKLRF